MRVRILASGLRFLVLNAVVLWAGSLCLVFGQTATGTITGTLNDTQGAAMASANVTVRNVDTGAEKSTVTNESGIYLVPLLQPGRYDVTVRQTGFATVERKAVAVQVGQTMRIDIEMPVASQQSLVTVTTDAPLLETEKTEQAQNVSENLVSNLPVSSRRWEQFALLTPGVNLDGNAGGMSFHGINGSYNNNSVDGANNNSSYNAASRGGAGSDGYVYSGDSIREFQVSSSGFSAEIGQAAGGAVNAVTKSGTNALHGDLFYNGRAPNLNAIDPVAQTTVDSRNKSTGGNEVATPSVRQQHQVGGSAGGPILEDKLFFFTTYDAYRKINPLTTTTQQLTPSIRDLTCPTLTPAGLTAGATVPNGAQCQAAKDFVFNNIVGTFSRSLRQDIELIKLDYQMNQANHANAVVNIRDWKNPTDPTSVNGGTSYLQSRFAIANWTMLISNSKVNEVRYQWGKDLAFNAVNRLTGSPGVQLSNLFNYGLTNGSTHTREHRNQISDNFSFTTGSHAFKTGIDLNFIHDVARSSQNSTGLYRYSSAVALGSNVSCVAPTGFSSAQTANTIFCDWLVDAFGSNVGDTKTRMHWTTYTQITDAGFSTPPKSFSQDFTNRDYATYFQDTWKARPNLTVNLGIRYDIQVWPAPPFAAAFPPILRDYTSSAPLDYGGIQPRLGVAWNFGKTSVLRLGGGLYYAKTTGTAWKTVIDGARQPQINCTTTSCLTSLGFPNVLFSQQDVLPQAPFHSAALNSAQQPLTPTVLNPTGDPCPCGSRGIDPEAVRPRAYQFQTAIEQQLPGNLNLSVSYVFTRGVHLPSNPDANIASNIDPATGVTVTKAYDVVSASGLTELTSTVPLFFRRIDPRTGPIIAQFSDLNSRYNGMVVAIRKPMSRGFEVLANYTLSKSTDNGQGSVNNGSAGFLNNDGIINQFDRKGEQGYTATDTRHRFTTAVVWQPGFGRNVSNKVARKLLDGWNLSTTLLASNGTRYNGTVSSNASQSVVIGGTTYRGLNGGMSGAALASTADPVGGRIAWIPRNSFSLPNLYNIDLRVAKQFNITERLNFELRGELFNLLNSTLVLDVSKNAYTYAQPSSTTPATNMCKNTTLDPLNGHTNTCMVPVTSFKDATITSGNLLGARQVQFGARLSF
jgi:hypothetical protein